MSVVTLQSSARSQNLHNSGQSPGLSPGVYSAGINWDRWPLTFLVEVLGLGHCLCALFGVFSCIY